MQINMPKYAKNMSKICKIYARYMQDICTVFKKSLLFISTSRLVRRVVPARTDGGRLWSESGTDHAWLDSHYDAEPAQAKPQPQRLG